MIPQSRPDLLFEFSFFISKNVGEDTPLQPVYPFDASTESSGV